jgi:hypothetical protein
MRDVFGWEPQPFAAPDYLVAPRGDGPGATSRCRESAGVCYLTDPAGLLLGLHAYDASA